MRQLGPFLMAAVCAAQQWVAGPASPQARSLSALAYQTSSGRMLLFGGGNDLFVHLADTWDYDGSTWRQLTPTLSPPGRWGHAMAYDLARVRTVLFGGTDTSGTLADTWEFDGGTWQRIPIVGPGRRALMSMVYDSARGRSVLFGGFASETSALLADTWEYDGSAWRRIATNGSPTGRCLYAMAYDAARGRTVLFGGDSSTSVTMDETWEYDGFAWTLAATPAPPGRYGCAMTFDAQRGRTLLFGGYNFGLGGGFGDTWEYDGSWHPVTAATPPSPRENHAMAYDLRRGRAVLFSGISGSSRVPGAAEFAPAATASFAPYGTGCVGSHGAPTLGAAPGSVPALGSTFTFHMGQLPVPPSLAFLTFGLDLAQTNGAPLPLWLDSLGMPGCRLWVDAAGQPVVRLPHTGTAIYSLAIPAAAELRGTVLGAQALVLDVAGGVTVSNGEVLRVF